MYAGVLKIQAFSQLICLDAAKLVSMFFTVKPLDLFVEVPFFSLGGGACGVYRGGKKEKRKYYSLC